MESSDLVYPDVPKLDDQREKALESESISDYYSCNGRIGKPIVPIYLLAMDAEQVS